MQEFANESDFQLIFKEQYAHLYNLAYKLTGDSDSSEDILQNVFLNIWNKRTTINVKSSIKAYLHRSVTNACFDFISKSKKNIALNQKETLAYTSEYTDQQIAHNELRLKLDLAIKNLPSKCQMIFAMSRFQGLTSQQIADEMNISKKTVDNQIGIALQKLRIELKEFITLNSISLLIIVVILLVL